MQDSRNERQTATARIEENTNVPPYRFSIHEVTKHYGTSLTRGLNTPKAEQRLQEGGANRWKTSSWSITRALRRRLGDLLMFILLGAFIVAWTIGEYANALLISIVLVFDVTVGLLYEFYAHYRMELLQRQVPRVAEVLRDGMRQTLPVDTLVPGDLITVRAGELVPADARLVRVQGLLTQEALLTGEAGDVEKITTPLQAEVRSGDQRNMLFAGTRVSTGTGVAIVTATGNHTILGTLAQRVQEAGWNVTPLERRLRRFGQLIAIAVLFAAALLFTFGVLREEPPRIMFLSVLTLAVAAIPEDLTFILTIALAVGATRLLRRGVLVRHLTASETLGDATVVAVDKTGTMTTGVLKLFRIEGIADRWNVAALASASRHQLLTRAFAGVLAGIEETAAGEHGGSTLDRALADSAVQAGWNVKEIRRQYRRFATLAFDARYRYRASLHDDPSAPDPVLFVVGAPEVVLPRCVSITDSTRTTTLSAAAREQLLNHAADAAADGIRVLAVCVRHLGRNVRSLSHADVEKLTFLVLLHFEDPVRNDAAEAVRDLHAAGARTLLLTGDHRGTAEAVAQRTGLIDSGANIFTGDEVERMSDRLLEEQLTRTTVVARADPFQKERIVRTLQRKGEVVAMLGDGINDAVALRQADLGVAVATATDVAKDASDLVLLKGGLSGLASAVQEGRRIRETVRTVLAFLFGTNLTELLAMAGAFLVGVPLPFLPAQLLWINMVTDGTAVTALALEPPQTRRGDRVPHARQNIFDSRDVIGMLFTACVALIPVFMVYTYNLQQGSPVEHARTLAFAVLALEQNLIAFSFRSLNRSMFRLVPWGNLWLVLSTVSSITLLVAGIHWEPFARLLSTTPLTAEEWTVVSILALLGLGAAEARKLFLWWWALHAPKPPRSSLAVGTTFSFPPTRTTLAHR